MTEHTPWEDVADRLLAEIFEDGNGEALGELSLNVEDASAVARSLSELAEHEAYVFNLAIAWRQLYRMTGATEALDRAIAEFERCADLISVDHGQYARLLTEIGVTVRLRLELNGDRADAERAVGAMAEVYGIAEDDPAVRAQRALQLGIALQDRYERTDQGDDLDAAVDLFRAAARDAPQDPAPHGAVGNALRVRFSRTRDLADLDQAIAAEERAVALHSRGGDPRVLNHFGLALEARYEATGDLADLERAIALFQAAGSGVPDGGYDQVIFSVNLGRALWERHGRSGDRADLEAAAVAYRRVLTSDYAPYGRKPPQVIFSYPFLLLELLGPGDTLEPLPEAVDAVRAFDAALEVFPAGGEPHGRLLGGRRAALARLPRPRAGSIVRRGGRTAFVLTGEHRGVPRRIVTILPGDGEILIGVGADPHAERFASTMSHVDRSYPDGDVHPTWLAERSAAASGEPASEIVLRYFADSTIGEEELALDALRCTEGGRRRRTVPTGTGCPRWC
ncbi:hypothetical protein GCM10022221_64980 [Actinocorallia aurea]